MPLLEQASTFGGSLDRLFLLFFIICASVLVLVTGLIVFFVIRYRQDRNPEPEDIEGNLGLELAWTAIPTALFLMMFYFGWTNYWEMRSPPGDAMVVRVEGRQWVWSFEYPDGRKTEELYLAIGRPVKLELRSRDVLHGFYIPAFRVKMDVVPGKVNYLWFNPTLPGTFDIQCTVICGTNHSYMLSKAHVLSEEDFKKWYFSSPAE